MCCNGSKNKSHILYLWTLVVLVGFGKQVLGLFPVEIDEEKQVWLNSILWKCKFGMCVIWETWVPCLQCCCLISFLILYCNSKSKNGGRKFTCSAFTPWFRKASWKVLTARMSLILILSLFCGHCQLHSVCSCTNRWCPQAFFCDQDCVVSTLPRNKGGKVKKNPGTLFTIVRNLVSVVVSKESFF